jgi:hypothetical protein
MYNALFELANWSNKTFVLYIGKGNPKLQYMINDITINEAENIKDLGVLVNSSLSPTRHINKITKTAYFRIKQLFRIVKSHYLKTWSNVFKTYVRPILEYGTEAWNPNLKKDVKRLERIQKFLTRIALTKCRLPYIPNEERLKLFDLRSLESRISDLIMVYKIINRLTHIYLQKIFLLYRRTQS